MFSVSVNELSNEVMCKGKHIIQFFPDVVILLKHIQPTVFKSRLHPEEVEL